MFFNCTTSYFTELPDCTEVVLVDLGLAEETSYNYKLKTPSGKVYKDAFTTLADGTFTIPLIDFPPRLFNPWAGLFVLQIFEGDNCDPTQFIRCGIAYDTVVMRFVESNVTDAKIGCVCVEVPA